MSGLFDKLLARPLVRRAVDTGFLALARRRAAKLDALDVGRTQADTLLRLVNAARETRFGRDHRFADIRTVADYQERVPLREYADFWRDYWQASYPNLAGVTWPEHIPYYALSSGTTTGATKYIPLSRQMLRSNTKAALTTFAFAQLAQPEARLLEGKFFFLGGSTDLKVQPDGSYAGDLSGVAAREMTRFQRPFTFPSLEVSLMSDWESKLERVARDSLVEPITAISGVPSWVLKVFDRVRQLSGKATVSEAWPHFRLVVHGGTIFEPYRAAFEQAIGPGRVKYCEVYPSSEGFIATEDSRHPRQLRVVPDHGLFYEFVPVGELGADRPTRHTLSNAEVGQQYAVALTTCAGLWGYVLGDTVKFTRRDVPLMQFTGRTKFFLSAFGEHLIQEEVDRAVASAAEALGTTTEDHHVGPVFPTAPGTPGHHLYLVEFRGPVPDLAAFARHLDQHLSASNEDYEAHRKGDLTMLSPVVRAVPPGGFAAWMASRGKVGGQHKVPRMDNTGELTAGLVEYLDRPKT